MTKKFMSGEENSFARYYLKNVAISEGCGCAELVVRPERPVQSNDSVKAFFLGLWDRFGRRRWKV